MDTIELIFSVFTPFMLSAIVLALVVILRRARPKPVRTGGETICLVVGSILLGLIVPFYILVWTLITELYFIISILSSSFALIAIIYFSWKRPVESGIVLSALSFPLVMLLFVRADNLVDTLPGAPGPMTLIFIAFVAPIIFFITYLGAGTLFLWGGLISQRADRNAAKGTALEGYKQ